MPLYRWEWRLRSSPEALWPLVADTNRFNRDVGLRGVETQPAADGRRRVRLGRLVEWEEEPFEWERPRRFSAVQRARDELGGRPLVLKAGLHYGPCIAVNQNDRLDYFGSTVNAAARLVGLSQGDLVLSGAVRDDPEVKELIDDAALEPLDAELRGFEERFELWRLRTGVKR